MAGMMGGGKTYGRARFAAHRETKDAHHARPCHGTAGAFITRQ
ncbi:hypothetical protein HNP33_004221 [Comamonas odontotermitis]|uniref:Uncharacterized protein n=1 Tax=Comamonas odontotermitis TaxID=379895 RepID=A0ABR6RLP1_9BURK|nr:hypothetical protein [Comamonas odontotermitis]MBB6580090.1 hypothetical protein [Comamonas odontotermitis]